MITLATLPQATEREVFEQAKNHLLTQNEKCMIDIGCAYRSDGKMCAAGCFISEEEYTPEMEEKIWSELFLLGLVPKNHAELIGKLQNIHDNHEPIWWQKQLNELEKTLSL